MESIHSITLPQGAPYDYIVDVESIPFDHAPESILRAVKRMEWASEKVFPDASIKKFNELLLLGYFEDQKISVSSLNSVHEHKNNIGSTMMTAKKLLGPQLPHSL